MSFFGFDTTLPRDHAGDQSLDPFDPTNDEEEDAAFEEKLRGLRAAGQEDVEIYTWGGGADGDPIDDGLGDLLEETGDDFNDDTFGGGVGNVGNDFDFAGGGGAAAPKSTTAFGTGASLPAFFDSSVAKDTSSFGKSRKADANAFASTMDDFWRMPTVKSSQQTATAPSTQKQQSANAAAAPQSLEEIEAQLRAQRLAADDQAMPLPPPSQSTQQVERRALTMEEVEAELRARRAEGQQPARPAGAAVDDLAAAFPPLGSQPAVPSSAPVEVRLPIPPMPNPNDPNAQAAIFARMRFMLETLPNPVQGRILSLPPYMHFGAVESVVRDFPALTVAASPEKLPQQVDNPRLWPRIDGSPEEQNTIRFMVDTALAKIDEAYRLESKRQIRMAKIRAMATRNNLMSRSDKDFITRIQVSQLITNDPYSDDFYAHIYFSLHGNRNRVTLPITSEEDEARRQAKTSATADTAAPAGEEAQQTTTATTAGGAQRKGRQQRGNKQQQTNRRETAMLRMQQQVERIVQGRNERIKKASGGAALEGALGRVSLSTTKAPRQMLQINQQDGEATGLTSKEQAEADNTVGMGHAQSAVQQALQGASLAQGEVQKRPALDTFEVLSILESLYDLVLDLEQSRRTAPADVSEQNEEPTAVAWRTERDQRTSQLWKELRVLEPLEISDPHPFVSLLSTVKGKRLLPRVLRHLSGEQTLTAMTMIVASFDRLDVVRDSVLLDDPPSTRAGPLTERRANVQRQTDAFTSSIVPSMLSLMATVPMRIVSGMLALFIERNDPVRVAQSKPGVAFLTIFLSRAASLRQAGVNASSEAGAAAVSAADLAQWSEIFNLLIQRLAQPPSQLTTLFPSSRAKSRLPFGAPALDGARKAVLEVEDRDVWQLMAAMAVSANMNQQQVLVTGLRDKILENVLEAKQWSYANPSAASSGEADLRIRNVNLLLHALNLDAAQITV